MLRAITAIIDRRDKPVDSISVYAVMGQPQGRIVVEWAGMEPCDAPAGPAGVTVLAWERPSPAIITLDAAPDLEAQIIAAAWAMGAWDILRTAYPAQVKGPLSPSLGDLTGAARQYGFICWTWRPMLGGPELRAKKWAARDTTLLPIMAGRDGDPPAVAIPIIAPGQQVTIRLGRGATPVQPRPKPALRATGRQRAAIVSMRRKLGEAGQPLPAALTRREASKIIKDLMMRLG